MDINRTNKWREEIKVDISQADLQPKQSNSKHIQFVLNNPEEGPGGYFIGFDGRKTKYLDLTADEKKDWMEQMDQPDIQDRLNTYIQKNQEER